jgi:hypothetical protein
MRMFLRAIEDTGIVGCKRGGYREHERGRKG